MTKSKCNHNFIVTDTTEYGYKSGYCEFCLREMAFVPSKNSTIIYNSHYKIKKDVKP